MFQYFIKVVPTTYTDVTGMVTIYMYIIIELIYKMKIVRGDVVQWLACNRSMPVSCEFETPHQRLLLFPGARNFTLSTGWFQDTRMIYKSRISHFPN